MHACHRVADGRPIVVCHLYSSFGRARFRPGTAEISTTGSMIDNRHRGDGANTLAAGSHRMVIRLSVRGMSVYWSDMSPAAPLPADPITEVRRQWAEHGWGAAADGMAAVTSVMRAHQIMLSRVERVLRPHGLTFARYEMLMLLLFTRSGALPMNKASARLQVHPTSITNVVDRLESAGLVRRRPHPTDRRTTLVAITDEGRTLSLAATEELNAHVFADPGLGDDGVEDLITVLTALRRGAGDFVDG